MSREVEKDYEKLFQTKVLQLLRKLLLKYRKVTRLEGFKYLEVETVGHVALNLGLHILYTFLLILCPILWLGEILMPCPSMGPK